MQSKRSLMLAIGVLAAIVAAYFAGRADLRGDAASRRADTGVKISAEETAASSSANAASAVIKGGALPPPGAPLKDHFAKLQARANAGDADAAKRLLRDLDNCSRLRGSEWKNAGTTNELIRKSTDGMSAAQLRTYQLRLDAIELREQRQRQNQAMCAGVNDKMLDSLVPNIEQAARLGDEQARACYLERGPLYDARSLLKRPDSLREYRNTAAAMIETGIASGDWRVVDLLQQAYEPGSQSLLAGLVGTDPVQHYRYLKLYRLGAEDHRAAGLDQQLAATAANLTAAQLAQADAWASNTLQQGFRGNSTNSTPQGWNACEF